MSPRGILKFDFLEWPAHFGGYRICFRDDDSQVSRVDVVENNRKKREGVGLRICSVC